MCRQESSKLFKILACAINVSKINNNNGINHVEERSALSLLVNDINYAADVIILLRSILSVNVGNVRAPISVIRIMKRSHIS